MFRSVFATFVTPYSGRVKTLPYGLVVCKQFDKSQFISLLATKKSPEKGDKKDEPRHVPMPEGYLKKQGQIKSDTQKNEPKQKSSFNLKLGNGDIEIDFDKALLLSLILLFAEEQADELLLTALVYMLG